MNKKVQQENWHLLIKGAERAKKGAGEVEKEASEDDARACKIVSRRLKSILRFVLIGPPYRATSHYRSKHRSDTSHCRSSLGHPRRVDEFLGRMG